MPWLLALLLSASSAAAAPGNKGDKKDVKTSSRTARAFFPAETPASGQPEIGPLQGLRDALARAGGAVGGIENPFDGARGRAALLTDAPEPKAPAAVPPSPPPAPATPGDDTGTPPPQDPTRDSLSQQLALVLTQSQQAYRNGIWTAEVDPLSARFEELRKTYDEWRKSGGDKSLQQRFDQIDDSIDKLKKVSRTIQNLKTQDTVPPQTLVQLDWDLRELSGAIGILPTESEALIAAVISRLAPPGSVQGDINWQINNARTAAMQFEPLKKYAEALTALQSSVNQGRWQQARDIVDHFFDNAKPWDRFMFDPGVIYVSDMLGALNPWGNYQGQFIHSFLILASELRSCGNIKNSQEFQAQREAIERGLSTIAMALPLSEKAAKNIAKARGWQRKANMINSVGNTIKTVALALLTFGVTLKNPVSAIMGLGGLCLPMISQFMSNYAGHEEQEARADFTRFPGSGPPLGEIAKDLLARLGNFFRRKSA